MKIKFIDETNYLIGPQSTSELFDEHLEPWWENPHSGCCKWVTPIGTFEVSIEGAVNLRCRCSRCEGALSWKCSDYDGIYVPFRAKCWHSTNPIYSGFITYCEPDVVIDGWYDRAIEAFGFFACFHAEFIKRDGFEFLEDQFLRAQLSNKHGSLRVNAVDPDWDWAWSEPIQRHAERRHRLSVGW